MADFEIRKLGNCPLYELFYKGKIIATSLKMEEAIDLIKEIQENEN